MSTSYFSTSPKTRKRRAYKNNQNEETPTIELNTTDLDKNVKKRKKQFPHFRLKTNGEQASLSNEPDTRIPLTLTDIQYLLLHSLLGNLNLTESPRWYVIDKCNGIQQTTCLVLEGISLDHWENYSDEFENTKNVFKEVVEVITPSVYEGSLVQELALVPLSEAEKESIIHKYGSMNLALEARKDLMIMMKAVFPIGNEISDNSYTNEDKFPRTQLVLSAWQLIEENYPVPLKGKLSDAYSDYVLTKHEYAPVTAKSPMFGIDCEMCLTNAGSELTRVSVVNEKHEVVYESLVKPFNEITDYLTRFSGITKSLLNDVTKRLHEVQTDLQSLLPPDAILVGQSLNTDLHALKMMHPYVIDTSLLYNFAGERTRKPKLKTLAKEFLNESIQMGTDGHCSTEDSLAALKLVQLKLSKSMAFGDAVHTNRDKFKENIAKMIKSPQYALSIFNHMLEQKKSSLVVGCDDITGDYHTYLAQAKESVQLKKANPKRIKLITVDSVEEVITSVANSVTDYNLSMAHLKIDVSTKNEKEVMSNVNKWIKTVWDSLLPSSLFVVLFGGTTTSNGLALVNVKHT
ncbi:RNA exonuclease 5 [Trichoplusia ni]|uniref:RNA exonuclease 5 n=1 Tax=Trichoplusia ni TaxID=7111 RepID=A0A7E5VR12_TRINI|nr:RNA exonuclease 5 [Trichoplusia ni]